MQSVMADGEDWLMRPVLRGMCSMQELKDGTHDLLDITIMNEALDVEAENRYRLQERPRGT